MNIQTPPKMTIEAFERWVALQERKHELVEGVPVMSPETTRNHSVTIGRIFHCLARQIDPAMHNLHGGHFAIPTGERSIRLPDIFIEPAGGDGKARRTDEAILIVEVLSPSTQHTDFGPKRQEYLALDSLDTYLVFAADEPRVWQWTRNDDGDFGVEPVIHDAREATVDLKRLAATIPLADIYAD